MNYSLYLIGSKARGDDNAHSDLDYVCIYDEAKPSLTLPGASVSYYSSPRMTWMVNNSKLFVAHLILEGKPVVENENHRRLLNTFSIDRSLLKKDQFEFMQSIRSLEWIPPGTSGMRWACDYLYTIARNIIYIENALDNYFCFGYQDATLNFLKKHKLESLLPIFIDLREEKYKYRNDDASASKFATWQLEKISTTLTGSHIHLRIGGISNLGQPDLLSYEHLRLVERAIINGEVQDNGYLNKLKNHGEYFFSLRKNAKTLLRSLFEMKSHTFQKNSRGSPTAF